MSRSKTGNCTLLIELNGYLATCTDLPTYRRSVDRSGQNLSWLRKASRASRVEFPARIVELLAMDIEDLVA